MKVLLSVLALALSTSVFGDEREQPPLVTTSGTAVIKVVPDLAELYFTVTVRDANLDEARKRQAERFAKVLAALRAAGIAETDLKSEQVEISLSGDEYEYAVVKEGEKEVYRVSQDIACNVSDVSKVTDISASVFAAGATSTRGATLRTSQLRKYRDEARIKAIRFAREKATALATELGATIGKPYTITEGAGPGWWDEFNTNGSQGGGGRTSEPVAEADNDKVQSTFAPGTISVGATIRVSFVLE